MNGIAATPSRDLARMKCIDPLTSLGPPSPVIILDINDDAVTIAVDRAYFPGSSVELVFNHEATFGTIERCSLGSLGYVLYIKRSLL